MMHHFKDKKMKEKMLTFDEEIVLGSAFRYALGSMTYVVSSTCSELIRLQKRVPEQFKEMVSREIQEYQDKYGKAGMEMDNEEWNYIKWLYDEKRHVKIKAKLYKKEIWEEYLAVKGEDGAYYSFEGRNRIFHTVEEI